MAELKELSPEDRAKRYAKWYYEPIAEPDAGLLEQLSHGPMDPSKAQRIENINDFLNPGYFEVETGYCILPNGAGYLAVNNKMPGVTADMVNWWFAWHSLDPLRYKIWYPPAHVSVEVSGPSRKKILDQATPPALKFQGIRHHVVEGIGGPPGNIWISFMTPEEFGFDMSRWHSPNAATLAGANGLSQVRDGPPGLKSPAVMMHFIREIPGGMEFRTRFWGGYQIIGRKPYLFLPSFVKLPVDLMRALAVHNVEEYTRLRAILPRIYAEEKDNWL
jgi:hypothetical protein